MNDEKIIELYFQRNENAISETALKYGKMIKAITYNILKNKQDSEECENDTYRIVWEKIPPASPAYFSVYLGRIARNTAFDRYDYNNAAKRNSELAIELSEIENCISSPGGVEASVESKQLAEHISNFLREINHIKRNVFIRRYWYSESISDIADEYGFSESKVKSMLMRTRKDLKKYFEKRGILI